jgi:protein gp37
MRMAARLEVMGQDKYVGTTRLSGNRRVWTGKIVLDRSALHAPHGWRKGRRVFVNSMSDLFHDAVPLEFIQEAFAVMRETPRHIYQILTKRADRLVELSPALEWSDNIWMGVSVENDEVLWRVDRLRRTAAKTKFLSCEPLLGPLSAMDPKGIDWVIAGGESGPGARHMDVEWVREIRDICLESKVAFHFKQWGGPVKSKTGRVLDGRTWDEMPPSPSILSTASNSAEVSEPT